MDHHDPRYHYRYDAVPGLPVDPRHRNGYNDAAVPIDRTGPETTYTTRKLPTQPTSEHYYSKSSIRHEIKPFLAAHTEELPNFSSSVDWADGDYSANTPMAPKPSHHDSARVGWRPFHLRHTFLLSFAGACIILIGLLAALYDYSEKHQGLGDFQEQWHYIFKYGPTAVLTIFAALWAQVEYRTKQLAPWNAMSNGPASANDSLFLDFISPWNILVLPKAIRLRHHAVSLAITGSILIQILIIISTALFVAEDRNFERQSSSLTKSFRVPDGYNGETADNLPFLYLQATNSSQRSYHLGTTSELAFQPYAVPSSTRLANPSINATVDTFASDLTCQVSKDSYFSNGYGEASVPDCDISWTSSSQELSGKIILMQPGDCPRDQRFLICAMDVQIVDDPSFGDFGEAGAGPGKSVTADPITCLICSPTYSIKSGNVTLVGNTATNVKVSENQDPRNITGLSNWQMGMSVLHSLGSTPPADFLGIDDTAVLAFGSYQFSTLLHNVTAPEDQASLFTDATILEAGSREVFRRLGAQNALLHFMSATNDTSVEVDYETIESRLCVQPPAFFATILVLLIVAIISILLTTFLNQRPVTCRDPGTILGLAAIIAKSTNVLSKLKGFTFSTWDELKICSSREHYKMAAVDGQQSHLCRIDTLPFEGVRRTDDGCASSKESARKTKPWLPFTMTIGGGTMLCTVPLVAVALLAGFLSKSKTSQGITNLPLEDRWSHYGWTLLPTTFFLGVSSICALLEDSVQTLQPFHMLHDRHLKKPPKSVWKDYSRLLAPQRLWYAVKYRHFAILASTIIGLLTPLLPIVSSGLFSPEMTSINFKGVAVKTTGWFNTSAGTSIPGETQYFNFSDPMMTSYIVYANSSFPKWTFSELALAEVDLETQPTGLNLALANDSTPLQLSVELQALRAVINCTMIPYESAATVDDTGFKFLQVNMTFPEDCIVSSLYSPGWNNSNGILTTQWVYKPGLIGYITPNMFGYLTPDVTAGSPCPTTMAIFGEIDDNDKPGELTVLTCSPYTETVRANAMFEIPSFDLAPPTAKGPPVTAIESSATYFNHDSFWAMNIPSEFSGTFDNALIPVNLSTPSPLSASDGFFQAMFQGIDAIADPRSLLGPSNSDSLIDAMDHLYRIIMAQCFNSVQGRRVPVANAADAPQPGPGVITDFNRRRLFQSATATSVLAGLLIAILLCTAITLSIFKPKGLSVEPVTIGARTLLMLNSGLLENMPEDAEWASDAELISSGLVDGLVLRSSRWPKKGCCGVSYGEELEYKPGYRPGRGLRSSSSSKGYQWSEFDHD